MVFIDGENFPPSIHGTGTEEISGGGAGPAKEYSGPYTGFHCVQNQNGETYWGTNGTYRFYLTDALRFHKSIRVSLEHGHNNDRANDYSSVAFWYQKGVNMDQRRLAPVSERMCTRLLSPPTSAVINGVFIDKAEVTLKVPDEEDTEIRYTLDGTEPTTQSIKYTEPIELTETATIKARAFKEGYRSSDMLTCSWAKVTYREPVAPTGVVNGLNYRYYEGQWAKLPDFEKLKAVESGTTDNFNINLVRQDDDFALTFNGYIDVPYDGIYTFYLVSDDGSKLYIGEQLVIDNDGLHVPIEKSGQVALWAGKHAITVTFFEREVVEELKVYYSGPRINKQLVPATVLFREQ